MIRRYLKGIWCRFLSLKIREKILYVNVFIIFLMLLVMGISIYYFSGSLAMDSFKMYSSKLMEQLGTNLSEQINSLSEFVTSQHMNSEISYYLEDTSEEESGKNQYNRSKYIKQYAYNLMSYRKEIKAVMIEDSQERIYFHTTYEGAEDISGEKILQVISKGEAQSQRGKLIWENIGDDLILAYKVLYSRTDLKDIGILGLAVDKSFFDDIIHGIPENQGSGLVILNHDAEVIASTNQESMQFAEAVVKKQKLLETDDSEIYYQFEKYIYSLKKAGNSNLYIMNVLNQEKLNSSAGRIFMPFLYASILAVGMAILLSGVLSQIMSKNIKLLLQKIQSFSNGDFTNRIEPESKDEIGELSIEFNRMSEKMQKLLDTIAEERLKNKNAEIKALQSEYDSLQAKINPHFLYNTLESINSMAKIKGETEIASAVQLLGNYLQDTVSRKNRFVSLKKELDNISDYIHIQQIIQGDRIRYQIEADEILLDAIVPKLILQPLVENAIVHGLEPKTGVGRIEIVVQCKGKDLSIHIQDNGVGIAQSKLRGGMVVEGEKSVRHSHVGILTVHKRIQILYGKHYGITVQSKEKVGTDIEVVLPILFEGEENVSGYFSG